ncbi:SPOCS domain-containing protein [Clostridium mediterraneense]|uniref:SPOCS domain-containing protein n=1 Tax=Clostridium mediterraneense TaxID=1805472 RepID=UPI00082EE368|nr:SPOCS domain-containing protein [Clostridium mediterraneense]
MEERCINSCDNRLLVEKCSNVEHAIVGDEIEYSITVINESDVMYEDVTIIDTLDASLEFVKDSVYLGNYPLACANVLEGVSINCLKPGEIKILTFKARVLYRPKCGFVCNAALAKYRYASSIGTNYESLEEVSNEVSVKIDIADIEVCKRANKEMASVGEVISYEIILTNVGTLDAKNILLIDEFPCEVCLVPNSLVVDCNRINYSGDSINIYVGNARPGESIVVNYKVVVKEPNCCGVLFNKAFVKFNYNLCNCLLGEKVSGCDRLSESEVKLGIHTFKQLSVDKNLCVPIQKPDIEEINEAKVEAKIVSCHVIETPVSISNEGQKLSGYKLIVKGELKEIIEYTSDTLEQSVHSAHYLIPFSSFVVLPKNYSLGSKIDIEAIVEDVYYKQLDCRSFFTNVALLINAKVLCCE